MGGRSMPWECEHGVTVDVGDFCESEICKQCEAKYNLMSNSQPTEQAKRIAALEAENEKLRALLARYRNETPLGHQPHMIAHEVDEALREAGIGEEVK